MQDDDAIMFGFYCITFIENMLIGKTLLDYANFLSPEAIKRMKRQYTRTLNKSKRGHKL